MKTKLYIIVKKTSALFTLAKFCGAILTVTILASIKYIISGSFHIEYCDFFNNIAIGLLGWTLNTGIIGWLREYLGIKGINFNLKHLLFGMDTMDLGGKSSIEDTKSKLYNAMDVDPDSDSSQKPDKGKGIDRNLHPNYDSNMGVKTGIFGSVTPETNKGKEVAQTTKSPFTTQPGVLPGLDSIFAYLPKRINPGPGFNVPGGEVPIRDEICKHIDYNSHILNQFKKMDLETAIQQRNNYLIFVQNLDKKMAYAQSVYIKIPTIPTTEYEFRLKNQIERDLENLNRDKLRSEAKATLLNSRIQFIEAQMNNSNNN